MGSGKRDCGIGRALVIAGALALVVAHSAPAAVPLGAGDIVVADQNSSNGYGQIVKVNPATGARTVIADAMNYSILSTPYDAAYLGGMLYVPDGSLDRINRVNPNDGSITPITQLPSGSLVGLMTVDAGGQLLVPDLDLNLIHRIDPVTGTPTVVSSGGFLSNPFGITTDPLGQILVSDYGGTPKILRIDPTTGAQTVVSSGGMFVVPRGLAVEADGNIVVVDQAAFGGNGGVIRVNPLTGAQTMVASGGSFGSNIDLALEADGDILVSMTSSTVNPAGGVLRINPVTGAQTPLSYGNGFLNPGGLTVIPEPATGVLLIAAGAAASGRARRRSV